LAELSEDVDRLLAKSDPMIRELADEVRRIIAKTLPEAEELVKWGNPTYLVRGENVAWILLYKDHVDLGFFQGAKMKSSMLEGSGKQMRHVKVRRPVDVDQKELSRLLKKAAALAR
jgi:hypothetical protein